MQMASGEPQWHRTAKGIGRADLNGAYSDVGPIVRTLMRVLQMF